MCIVWKIKYYSKTYNEKQQSPALCLLISYFYLVFKMLLRLNITQVIFEYVSIGMIQAVHKYSFHFLLPHSILLPEVIIVIKFDVNLYSPFPMGLHIYVLTHLLGYITEIIAYKLFSNFFPSLNNMLWEPFHGSAYRPI